MPPENDDSSDVVRDTPREGSGESAVAEIARDSQTKTGDQKEQEKQHSLARRNYETPSSEVLPKLDFELDSKGMLTILGLQGKEVDAGKAPKGQAGDGSAGSDTPGAAPGKGEEGSLLDRAKAALDNIDPSQAANKIGGGRDKGSDAGDKAPLMGAGPKGSDKLSPESENVMKHLKDSKVPMSPEKEGQMRKDLAEIDKLPPEQRKKVLESIDKVATTDTKLTKSEDRAELAASLAHQIAHPEDIKQGDKNTCVSANVEKTLAMQHPDQYADMVAQLATKGEYTLPPGKDGKPPTPPTVKAQLDPDGTLADRSDPKRSATSDLMQTAITNMGMKNGETYEAYKPGHEPVPDPPGRANDTGERVKGADGKVKEFDGGLDRDAKEKVLDRLCPKDGYEHRRIEDKEDLAKAWKDNGGNPPLNVTVRINAAHTGMPGSGDESRAGGTHAVSITHIDFGPDGKPTQVYYENTAGGTDHSYPNGKPVPADEFVKSMQSQKDDGSKGQPMEATVRTDGDKARHSEKDDRLDAERDARTKRLEKDADDFWNAQEKQRGLWGKIFDEDEDAMLKALEGKTKDEIEEMNRIYKAKHGEGLATAVDRELADDKDYRFKAQQALKGTDAKK